MDLLKKFFSRTSQPDIPPHPRGDQKYSLEITSENLKRIFSDCADFEQRPIYIGIRPAHGVTVSYIDGVVSSSDISDDVVRPLTESSRFKQVKTDAEAADLILHGAVYSVSVKQRDKMDDLADDLTSGFSAIIFDSLNIALTFEARTTNQRSISSPEVEKSVSGAKDTFIERLRVNTSLVRRKLHDPRLKLRQTTVGRRSHTTVGVFYIDTITDMNMLDELMRRLDSIDIDGVLSAGNLENYIVDDPRSPFPQLIRTERPDKFCINLLEGRIGIIINGLPIGFLLPATLTQFIKVPDDNAQHFIVASALTLLRWASIILTIFLPAMLVAVVMYHQEMVPTKLLLSLIENKQQVPFSVAVEVISMLIAFELLQEAGIRLPDPVGQTVSIIGALIVGQSAVEARVISPIAVIVVAFAGISGYAQPSQELGAALRILRFLMVFAALIAGMFGLIAGLILVIYHICSLESFGVAYISPIADGGSMLSALIRLPIWTVKFRAPSLNTSDKRNQR